MMPATTRNIPTADRPFRSPPRGIVISAELRLDAIYCGLLLVLTAIMLLPSTLSLPMEVWDESRNANNAIEMARHGDWMVPAFGGVPDHWNTKPPLLIWIIAGLLRTGMDPMLAVRLPSVAAAMGCVLLVYLTCRVTIKDRLAGLLAALLMLCSVLFMGDHVGRTGDYDALLSLLCLGYVLCIGRFIDAEADRSGTWIVAGASLLFLALMTKGIAAGLPLPGLLAYAIARGRFVALTRDWRLWLPVTAVLAGVALFLAEREHLDPGYLAALWNNDVAGRMVTVLDNHDESPFYYLMILAVSFQPAVLLLPTLLCMRGDADPARRRLCLLMVLTACSWLIALSAASTKVFWYVAPVVPLLAIAIGTATTTYLRGRGQSGKVVLRPIIFSLLIAFWYLNIRAPDSTTPYTADQVQYGGFLDAVRDEIPAEGAVIVDQGLPNDAGFENYNPVARFFAAMATWRGVNISVAAPGALIATDAAIVSCDPQVRDWLNSRQFFTTIRATTRCVMGRVSIDPATKPAE